MNSDRKAKSKLVKGCHCLIYSNAKNKWYRGVVDHVVPNTKYLIVKYCQTGRKIKISRFHVNLQLTVSDKIRLLWVIGSVCKLRCVRDDQWYDCVIQDTFYDTADNSEWLSILHFEHDVIKTEIQRFSVDIQPLTSLHKLNQNQLLASNVNYQCIDNVYIEDCNLNMSQSGMICVESERDITLKNCTIDLTLFDNGLRLGCCNRLTLINTKIYVSASQGWLQIICNFFMMDRLSAIHCFYETDMKMQCVPDTTKCIQIRTLSKEIQKLCIVGFLRKINTMLQQSESDIADVIVRYCTRYCVDDYKYNINREPLFYDHEKQIDIPLDVKMFYKQQREHQPPYYSESSAQPHKSSVTNDSGEEMKSVLVLSDAILLST